jgi:hypothetical protein
MTSPAIGTSALSTFVTSAATHSFAHASLMAAIFMLLGMLVPPLAPWYQCHLSAFQPERHLHSAIQLDSGGKLGARLLWTAYPIIQDAKAAVAVRLEGAHAQLVSQGECLEVEGFGWFDL